MRVRRLTLTGFVLALVLAPAAAFAQQAETIEYYGTDAIGSIRIVWDASGTVIARQDFTPFGEPVLQQGTAIPKEGFGGNETDAETNQDYFHARMFEARTGRFTRTDPIEDGVGEPQRWNRYAYALNNPLVFTDVEGMNADPCDGTNWGTGTCVTAHPTNADWDPFGGDWSDWFWADSSAWASSGGGSDSGRDRSGGGGTTTTTTSTTPSPDPNPNPNPNPNPKPKPPPTIGPAPHSPWLNSCVNGALGEGALSIGVDSIGLIPEAGGIARILGHQAGYVGVVADQAGSRAIAAVDHARATVQGLEGLADTSGTGLLSTGLTVAGFIPGLNDVAAGLSIGLDVYKTAKAIGQCR